MKLDTHRLNILLAQLVDETITKLEIDELESLLDGNPTAQSHYFHYLGLHDDLAHNVTVPCTLNDRTGYGPRPYRVQSVIIAAAISLIAVCFFLFLIKPGRPVAEIVDFGGPVRWVKQNGESTGELKPGIAIRKGWLETRGADSWAEIRFYDDTRVQISGIAKLHIETVKGQKKLNLANGNVSVDASPQPAGKPLRLITTAAEAEVLGTQFNVAANDFSTRLEVNEGLVKVKRLADGLTEEVKPNHEVIASLESGTEFVAHRRKELMSSWKSQLPRDILQGKLTTDNTVRAHTHIWRGDAALNEVLDKPVLLHSVVLDPSAAGQPRVKIELNRRLLISGRIEKPTKINIGFTTRKWNGGFSGKYTINQTVTAPDFELEIPLDRMKPSRATFPESPIGEEMVYLWIQTVREDKGLEILKVELTD